MLLLFCPPDAATAEAIDVDAFETQEEDPKDSSSLSNDDICCCCFSGQNRFKNT